MSKNYFADSLLKEFFESEKSSGYVLVFLTIVSLLLANIFVGNDYVKFWHQYLDLSFSSIQLKLSIEHWINDGLMVIFFLLVGLEIEREIYIGELSSIKKSALPAIAALGGMMIPALIHFAFNANTTTQSGFGIPMATDIAFTLGVLSLLGSKIPISLKIFLTALAIIDDLGAILIIAFFYTSDLSFAYLIGSLSVFALLLIFNRMKINKLSIYLLLGLVMWYLMLKSGVHATIAGVLLAFAIPFNKNDDENISYKLQHYLHKPVAFLVLPIFALANTAIIIPTNIIESITTNNSLGIFFGLSFGKLIGIFFFSFIAVKIGFGVLPKDLNWKLIAGAASLAGIGFTMSIFITNLAFSDVEIINASKLIIIIASVVSAISGLTILNLAAKK
ncbi:MAG: Na+/H+ antiporter NhaA [Ignavibacteriales bacterium]|nr:Na+/H+ antiporter NhaA [Ignavibacteriales bacterium]